MEKTNRAATEVDRVVGANIRRMRILRGLSQETVADRCNVTFQQIQKYESGFNRVSASRVHQLAGVFECELSELFDGVGREATREIPADALGLVRDYVTLDSVGKIAVRAVAAAFRK